MGSCAAIEYLLQMSLIRILLALVTLGLLLFCASPSHVQKASYADKSPKYAIAYDSEGKKHGLEEWWYPNGQIKFRGHNQAGERHGEYTAWHEDGRLWYQGFADQGRKDSTLTYWYPNGNPQVIMTYDQGRLLKTVEYNLDGRKKETREEFAARKASEVKDSLAQARDGDMQVWVMRVRKTMEGYWRPPQGPRVKNRAVAKITVRRDGKILDARLIKTSENAAFNREALNTFKRVRGFPPLPESHPGPTLDLQYEFVPPVLNRPQGKR